ncbi:hypothetical protein [Nocardia sp. NPDC058480]|uniref:hypothetical protein n=1 Tax=Nocardia sp. NPDC058480 TaxID=3346522 RepID=UPI00365F4494
MGYRRELAREVGGEVHAFELLSEAEAKELVTLFRTARADEARALRRAINASVAEMPGPLRKLTRTLLFGS